MIYKPAGNSVRLKHTAVGTFPEDWEVTQLAQLGTFKKGRGVKKDEVLSYGLPCVRYGELYTKHHNYIKKIDSFISDSVARESQPIKYGDILFAGSGETREEIGKCAAFLFPFNAYAGGDIIILSPSGRHNSLFLGFQLNHPIISSQKAQAGQGDAVVHIYPNSLASVLVPVPPLPEQTAIAEALSDADALIASLEKLIEKKKKIKQGAMQELLRPKEGWVKKRLGELGECMRGVSYGMSDLHSTENLNTVRLLRSNNIKDECIIWEDFQVVNELKVKNEQLIQKGDILICMANGSKALVGKSAFFSSPTTLKHTFGAFMGLFRTEAQIADPYFVYLNFKSNNFRSYIDVLLSGSSINNLKPSDIESIPLYLPTFPEQLSISEAIRVMENEILALQVRLVKVAQLKKGMMQYLLTGRIRLI